MKTTILLMMMVLATIAGASPEIEAAAKRAERAERESARQLEAEMAKAGKALVGLQKRLAKRWAPILRAEAEKVKVVAEEAAPEVIDHAAAARQAQFKAAQAALKAVREAAEAVQRE